MRTGGASSGERESFRISLASSTVRALPVMEANAFSRINEPSSARMFVFTAEATKRMTSSGTKKPSVSAFLRRIAMRVSRSGALTSATTPHSKREIRRCSDGAISLGERSEEITTCFFASKRLLKVWKNSCSERSLPMRNWMSSMSRQSRLRYLARNSSGLFCCSELMKSLTNCSLVV